MAVSGVFGFLWAPRARADRYGDLIPDPNGILDLPAGFSYRILERVGDAMDDGYRVPGRPDGMECFRISDERALVLMRNHELVPAHTEVSPYGPGQAAPPQAYAPGSVGGVTRVVLDDRSFERRSSNLVLVGTDMNCSGGRGPGGWFSCEETVATDHGYVFLCSPSASEVAAPFRIPGYGRFRHEAAVWDSRNGVVYMTEDRPDGCVYRFVPSDSMNLFVGTLQAMRVGGVDRVHTSTQVARGQVLTCDWIDIDEPDPIEDTVRVQAQEKGAAIFVRGEGLSWREGALYVACTAGGAAGKGQIFRHVPDDEPADGGTLELIAEADPEVDFHSPDNLSMSPWGELFIAEDSVETCRIRILDQDGSVHAFARNAGSTSEFAGLCFSPEGDALFCNIQDDGLTLVISGPFGMGDPGGSTGGDPDPGEDPDSDGETPFEGEPTAECACRTEDSGRTRARAWAGAALLFGSRPRRR